jgi:hypothetical protein
VRQIRYRRSEWLWVVRWSVAPYRYNFNIFRLPVIYFILLFRSTFKDNLNNADKNTLAEDSSQQYSAANILTTNKNAFNFLFYPIKSYYDNNLTTCVVKIHLTVLVL